MSNTEPTKTPNVVIQSPQIRRVANIVVGSLGIILGTIIVVDGSSPFFDWSQITGPASAGLLYLGSALGLAVTIPNIPRRP